MRAFILFLGRKEEREERRSERREDKKGGGRRGEERRSIGLTCITGNVSSQKSLTWTRGTIATWWLLP